MCLSFAFLPQARVWIERWIADIDKEFDFILITERFDVSLAVMMVKFCWDIDDVAYVKLNRQVSVGKKPLTAEMKSQIENLNWADLLLYKHFNSKLDAEIKQIGNEKIEKIVSEIRNRSQVLQDECIDETQQMINDEGVIWPTLKENRATNITCWTSTRGKLSNVN